MSIKLGSSLLAGNLDKNMYPSKDEMNELFSSSVKLDGDQEIDGVKTFNDNLYAPNQLDYSRITNCITEISQDINLELVDGVLTLKAGSKVYVPNGFETDGTTPKFDVVMIESDKQLTVSDPNSTVSSSGWFVFYSTAGWVRNSSHGVTFSGATAPTLGSSKYAVWYDTTNNIIKYTSDKGVTWTIQNAALPLCTLTRTSGIATSIDQIFNGFGYIGNTVFALPGVKGLIPNGRNEDGSLKNIAFTIDKVKTNTNTSSHDNQWIFYDGDNLQDRAINNTRYYDENENKWFITNGYYSYCLLFTIKRTNGVITSFTPKTTFHAVDYNDLKQVELPTGSVIAFAGDRVPSGYLICNGATVSRTTYDNLFEVIGTTYGAGDGSTTFNLPQLSDGRFIRGESTAGNVHVAGLPNITGTSNWQGVSPNGSASGAFGRSTTSGGETFGGSGSKNIIIFDFNASRSSGVYGRSTTVMPQSLSMRYYIKY